MAIATYSVPVQDEYGESVTLATTISTAGMIQAKWGYPHIMMHSTSSFKYLHTPRIMHVIFYDSSTTTYTRYSQNAIDRSDSTDVSISSMTATDYLYILTNANVGGFYFNMDTNVNDVAATLDMEYYKVAGWTDVTGDSDGTNLVADTLKQDGIYAFTAPTDAQALTRGAAVDNVSGCFAYRFKPSTTLTANTAINGIQAIADNTDYVRYPAGAVNFNYDTNLCGGLQVLSVSGTPTLYINHSRYRG